MSNIADTLSSKGHDVVVFQQQIMESLRDKKVIRQKNVKIIDYEASEEGKQFYSKRPKSTVSKYWTENQAATPFSAKQFADTMSADLEHMCIKMFKDTSLHDQLKAEKFDVVISEPFDPCGLYLSDYLGIPSTIVAMASSRIDPVQWAVGQASGLNFIPGPNSKYGKSSNILDRLNNIWQYYTRTTMFRNVYSNLLQTVRTVSNQHIRDIDEIVADSAFLFFNSNPYLDFPFPSITKCVPIGGFSMNVSSWKEDKIPKDLDEILKLRNKTVFISFGSVIRSADMPQNYLKSLVDTFNKLDDVTFLWKYEEDEKSLGLELPPNVFTRKWFPQTSLLADERVSLFVTHGGLGSIMEVAYAGKPAIVVPLFFDQPMNGEMLSRHGGAEVFSKFDLSNFELFSKTIRNILDNESYHNNAIRLSNMLMKQPIDPVDRLVKHAEFAAEFKHIPELDPYARQLNFFQFYFLDIISIFGVTVYIVFKSFKFAITKFGHNKQKND